MSAGATYARLAELFAPGERAVAADTLLAVDDPARYAKRFAERMDDRNQDEVDPWIAFVDALEARRGSCGLDWKFAAEDIVWNLARLRVAERRHFTWYDEDAHLETKTYDFLELCGRALSAHGVALVYLDIDSDSYECALLPWGDLAEAQRLAKRLKQRIVSLAPKKPLATPLPDRPKRPKGAFVKFALSRDWYLDRWSDVPHGFIGDDQTRTHVETWPPKVTKVAESGSVVAADGVEVRWWLRQPRRLVVDGKDIADRIPEGFALATVVLAAERVVLLPSEPTCRGGKFRRPLVWDGKRLAAAAGLPDAKPLPAKGRDKFPTFLRQGVARTGDGTSVLLWEGRGWIDRKGKLVAAYDLSTTLPSYSTYRGVPAHGDAFYVLGDGWRGDLVEIRAGAAPRRVLPAPGVIDHIQSGSDGTVLLSRIGRKPKDPVVHVFFPETGEVADVPPALFGVRRNDYAEVMGATVSGDRMWIVVERQVRAVPWATIAALPRRKTRASR